MPQHGELRIWHIPQIPMIPFYARVENCLEAKILLNALAEYDLFQFEHHIKPDFSHAQGFTAWDATEESEYGPQAPKGAWRDWYDEYGNELSDYTLEELREMASIEKLPKWEMEVHP